MGKLLGTLVVVVFKARNLVNKRTIGKQDPFCSVALNSDKKRTKTVKKGGQSPEWDDELRFEVWQDAADETKAELTATGGVKPVVENGSVSSTASTTTRIIKQGPGSEKKILKVAVYSDDPRDPDLIGEGSVDLADTLKKGEFDEWVKIEYKGRYTGEVYIEMTFYSAAPAPPKPKPQPGRRQGDFEPLTSARSRLSSTPTASPSSLSSRPISAQLNPEDLPPSLRASSRQSSHPQHHASTYSSMRNSVSIGNLSEWGVLPGSPGHPPSLQGTAGSASIGYHSPAELLNSGTGYSHSYRRDSYPPQRYSAIEHQRHDPGSYRDEIVAALERPLSSLSINKPLPPPTPVQPAQQPVYQQAPVHSGYHSHQGSADFSYQQQPPAQYQGQINPYLSNHSNDQQHSYQQPVPDQNYPSHSYSTPVPLQGPMYASSSQPQSTVPFSHQPQYQYQQPKEQSRPLPVPEQDYAPQEMHHANTFPGAFPQQVQGYLPPRSPIPQQQPPIPPRTPANDFVQPSYASPPVAQYGYQNPTQSLLLPPGTPQPVPTYGRHSPVPPAQNYGQQNYVALPPQRSHSAQPYPNNQYVQAPQPVQENYAYAQRPQQQIYAQGQGQGQFTPYPEQQAYGYQQAAPIPQQQQHYQHQGPILPPRSPQPYYSEYQPDSQYLGDNLPPPPRPLPIPASYDPSGMQAPPQGWSQQQYRENGRR